MFLIYVIPVKQDLYKPMILYSNISPKCIPKKTQTCMTQAWIIY